MHEWFSREIVDGLRREIAAADNNEVYFCARLQQGRLTGLHVLARGNKECVPAPLPPEGGGGVVVIHNHPSGDLTPSGADIAVAARLAREGYGFVIINNEATRYYVVVEPCAVSPPVPVEQHQIEEILAPGGLVNRVMPGFENRPQQVAMAASVGRALNDGRHALAEAGTGTGKSLAYLVPLILWARANKKRGVVSTNTINLQEQLLYKDIPLLQKAIPGGFKAVLVKGRSNYLCRRKFRDLIRHGADLVDEKDIPVLQDLVQWEQQTGDGSRSDLPFVPRGELWELVCSDADACLRLNCPHFRDCFFHNARREAIDAHILIANHSLLFADIALRSKGADTGVLPEYHAIVLDEAHNIERVATDYLGARVTRLGLIRLLGRLRSARYNKVKGLLPWLERTLAASLSGGDQQVQGVLKAIQHNLVPELLRLEEEVNGFFAAAENFLAQMGAQEIKAHLTADLVSAPGWATVAQKGKALLSHLEEAVRHLGALYRSLEGLGPQIFEAVLSQTLELAAIGKKLADQHTALKEILFGTDAALVRWAELDSSRTGTQAQFNFAPLAVGAVLKENVWRKYSSVVLTSATLTVAESFKYMRDRLGLDADLSVQELRYGSPFDYQKNAVLGVATDLPDPEERAFPQALAPAILASLTASRGRALVLFTSFSLLRAVADAIRNQLAAEAITLLCQGEMPRHLLLDKFKADTRSVLLATASFWEGVDVAGESLSSLILTRLPFTVPDDPVVQARMEDLRSQGKNPFYHYQLPQAVLRFKQGFGRLIRSKQDKGAVLVLDKRIVTRSYGRWFLKALPPCPARCGPLAEILAWQAEFLNQ